MRQRDRHKCRGFGARRQCNKEMEMDMQILLFKETCDNEMGIDAKFIK